MAVCSVTKHDWLSLKSSFRSSMSSDRYGSVSERCLCRLDAVEPDLADAIPGRLGGRPLLDEAEPETADARQAACTMSACGPSQCARNASRERSACRRTRLTRLITVRSIPSPGHQPAVHPHGARRPDGTRPRRRGRHRVVGDAAHIPGLLEYEHADVVALADPDPVNLGRAAERFGVGPDVRESPASCSTRATSTAWSSPFRTPTTMRSHATRWTPAWAFSWRSPWSSGRPRRGISSRVRRPRGCRSSSVTRSSSRASRSARGRRSRVARSANCSSSRASSPRWCSRCSTHGRTTTPTSSSSRSPGRSRTPTRTP